MQKIFCVKYSMDSKFLLSGSDDGNIRLWKAEASEKLGPVRRVFNIQKPNRERSAIEYRHSLQERYKHMPEIKRISK